MPQRESIDRRKFLTKGTQAALVGLSGGLLAGCASRSGTSPGTGQGVGGIRMASAPEGVDLVVAEGGQIKATVKAAIQGFGGIEKFVHKGDRVVLSPNIAFARMPEQASCTHPDVIRAVINLCEEAGAAKVTVLDYTLDNANAAFDINGAAQAVAGTKATLISPDNEPLYQEVSLPSGSIHGKYNIRLQIPKEILRSNVFIPIPVVKDHEAATVSLSMKKLMGCIWDRRSYHRTELHPLIAELAAALRPTLIIADATRALQTHGPKGPGEVTRPNQIVVGTMPVSVDSFCCKYLTVKQVKPKDVPHIVLGAQRGLGEMDVTKLRVKEVTV